MLGLRVKSEARDVEPAIYRVGEGSSSFWLKVTVNAAVIEAANFFTLVKKTKCRSVTVLLETIQSPFTACS
jgi:hypothetical protein